MLIINLLLLFSSAFILNVPLGYLRRKKKKFSASWFFYIHASIPFLYFLRQYLHIKLAYVPFCILFAIAGQLVGAKYLAKLNFNS